MSKEKQILHMLLDGYSQRRIASTLCVSRNTVAKVAKAASDHQLSKDALESWKKWKSTIHFFQKKHCSQHWSRRIFLIFIRNY